MSNTRTFRIGHVEVFQDKPSKETQMAIECMHDAERKKALDITDGKILGFALSLKDKTEAEISIVINSLLKRIDYYKANKTDL